MHLNYNAYFSFSGIFLIIYYLDQYLSPPKGTRILSALVFCPNSDYTNTVSKVRIGTGLTHTRHNTISKYRERSDVNSLHI